QSVDDDGRQRLPGRGAPGRVVGQLEIPADGVHAALVLVGGRLRVLDGTVDGEGVGPARRLQAHVGEAARARVGQQAHARGVGLDHQLEGRRGRLLTLGAEGARGAVTGPGRAVLVAEVDLGARAAAQLGAAV